ncbi:TNF receptor-associated factor 6-like isoform X2 [Hetaerina americana]|uniref:TNF receptor-associated factor 6-like isoform X2 n=1 Tax=Hetaerina americana TaxID=62018 RepID=UPI003A7F4110
MAKDNYGSEEKSVYEAPCENVIIMDSRQKGSSCPIDVKPLSHQDIFPDNFTRREIVQAKMNSTAKVGVVAPTAVLMQGRSSGGDGEKEKMDLSGGSCGRPHDPLMAAMYERIILLEQRAHEQDIVVENLRRKVAELQEPKGAGTAWAAQEEKLVLRCCHGLFAWRIKDFSAQLELMQGALSRPAQSTPQMLYSPRFYTQPTFGYRFCVRLNLSPRNPGHLSLVVHVVRGDFDDILHWPFTGRITLEMVNQRDFPRGENLRETVSVGGEGTPRAFSRPPPDGQRSTINPRGFGYMEFVALADLEPGGFLVNDMLVVKVCVEQSDRDSSQVRG